MGGYSVLRRSAVAEVEAKKSRFIAYLERIESKDDAMALLERIRAEHPTAIHHCWAFIVGDPDGSNVMGMSDDREPHGTAGKPMLSVLAHKRIGDVAVIVVRYWGGTKLGTGGLVRAYSGAVQAAVDDAELEEKIETARLAFAVQFAVEPAVRRMLAEMDIPVTDVRYSENVSFYLTVPADTKESLSARLSDLARGQIDFLQ
jgi:uncharacterized YigZ family protein